METRFKKFLKSPISDGINLAASVIGILGFLTGMTSIPFLVNFYIGDPDIDSAVWFGGEISYSITVPLFIITYLFVFGIYYLFLVKFYKVLHHKGFIFGYNPKYKIPTSDTFSIIFFTLVGVFLEFLVARAFFIVPGSFLRFWNSIESGVRETFVSLFVLFVVPASIWFISILAKGAREAGTGITIHVIHLDLD